MAGTSSSDAELARKTWELENNVETLSNTDDIYRYDAQEQQQFLAARKFHAIFLASKRIFIYYHIVLCFDCVACQVRGKKIHIISKTFKYQH